MTAVVDEIRTSPLPFCSFRLVLIPFRLYSPRSYPLPPLHRGQRAPQLLLRLYVPDHRVSQRLRQGYVLSSKVEMDYPLTQSTTLDLLPLLPQTDYFSHLSPAQQLQLWRNRVEVAQQIAHLYNNNNRVKLRQLPGAHFAHSPTCRDQMVDLWLEWRSSLGPAAVNYDLHIAHGRIPPLQTVQALRSIDRTSARTVFGLYSLFGIRVPCEVYELNEEFRSIPRRRRRVREVKKLRATGGRKGKGRQIDEEGGEEDERAEDEVDEVDEVEESWALRALSLVDAEEPTASVIGSATGALSLGSIPAEGQDDVGAGDDASLFVYEGLGAAAGKSTRGKAGGVTSRNIGEFVR